MATTGGSAERSSQALDEHERPFAYEFVHAESTYISGLPANTFPAGLRRRFVDRGLRYSTTTCLQVSLVHSQWFSSRNMDELPCGLGRW